MQLYGTLFVHIDQTAYIDATKYHKTACSSLPEDEYLVVSKHVEDIIIEINH
jgi:hypothetical protein